MFKVVTDRTFTRDVAIFTPLDGGFVEEKLKTTYALISVEEARTFDLTTAAGTDGFLDRVVRRFDDLTDGNDQPLPYNDEVRGQILKMPHVRQGLVAEYFQAVANDGPKKGN